MKIAIFEENGKEEQFGIVDKTDWLDGPWKKEPDKIEWRDEKTGLPCLIVRNELGALCGYVAVLPGHPLYNVYYSSCAFGCAPAPVAEITYEEIAEQTEGPEKNLLLAAKRLDESEFMKKLRKEHPYFDCWDHQPQSLLRVHGGITYSGFCEKGGLVCYKPKEGEPDNVYWFGFDCAHSMDMVPGFTQRRYREMGITSLTGKHGESYRDVAYVTEEVEKLAVQLHAFSIKQLPLKIKGENK